SGGALDLKTQVQTPQGMKEISNIQVGDLVLSNTGYNEVLNVFPKSKKKSYKITLEDGKEIICSEEHLFPTQTGEMNISGGLKEGMCLYVKEMMLKKILKIEELDERELIDIEVSGNHLFYANDILTHN
uniref:cyanophage-like gp41-1 intein n=1 Tax=metagenome TaxID=256318 RepID=UPI001298EAC6